MRFPPVDASAQSLLSCLTRESRVCIQGATVSKRLVVAVAAALTLSPCGMLNGMTGNRSGTASGDGGNTGAGNPAVGACQGLSGPELRNCLDRQGLNRSPDRTR